MDQLLKSVVVMGIKKVQFVITSESSWIPKTLRLPFMLGPQGLIHGEK
ncbi:MAG: hypothetical protein PHU24_07140 [Sphaerochaetaceae bacterium]|nr:hypothetical protein [Sphaerochaetaceae bacterium]NLO60309.1 hypothetical protein [Spirochaetales bacterium]MDD2406209.1 hypothetical protein [Sphaerochaetaceae bacterium]MDD4258683.1 hypothetical protein [Sphaerochaetaceae bacterium]MDD4762591.1 hypothetical protein [Sphaerochaetaceae bacterium]